MLLTATCLGQTITCPSPYIYMLSGPTIMAYNTTLPISSTNPSSTGIPSPPGNGLTLMPNISGGTLTPTFYSTGSGSYQYWSGTAWVNAGVSTGSGGVNLGGCSNAIYSLIGSSVYCHTMGSTTTSFVVTVIPSAVVADLVPDCNCNFYIFSAGSQLIKYSPSGVLLASYTLTGLSGSVSGGGYAIVGNNVYCIIGATMYVGTIGVGSTIAFTALPGTISGGSDWASCSVDLNSVPVTGTINVNASSCQTASLIATSNSAVTYSWTGPGITTPATNSMLVTNSTGIYSCTIFSSGCGAAPTLSLTAAMGNNTCISVTSTSITCANLGSATVSVPGTGGPYSFTWMPSAQIGSVATGLSPGNYTLSVFDAFTNLTYTATTLFTSLIPLTGSVNSSSSITCNGAATGTAEIVNLSGGSGNQSYLWTNGVTSYTQASLNTLSAGLWSVTVKDLLTGCTLNQSLFITQPPPITLSISANTPSVCLGGNVVLTGTASGGSPASTGYIYTWAGGSSGNTKTVSPLFAGNHVYTLQASDQYSCQINNTISVNIIPNPTLTVVNTSICPLQTGTLTVSGATNYTWTSATLSVTGMSFTDNPITNTQYTVVGSALGCNTAETASIIIKPIPFINVSPSKTVCEGNPFVFNAFGGNTYNWEGPQAFSSSLQINSINAVQLNQAGAYNVTVTAVNSCTAPGTTSLTVSPLPLVTISPNNFSICTGSQTVLLTANGTASLYNWSPVNSLSSNSLPTVVAHPSVTTVYTLKGTLNSCTAIATATVFVLPPPVLNISFSSSSICAQSLNGSLNASTITSSGAITYTIMTPSYINSSNPSGPSSQISMLSPYFPSGPATVTVQGSNGACTVSTTALFTIVPNPSVAINNPTTGICLGSSYTYSSIGANSYTWSTSSSGSTVYSTGSSISASPLVNSVFSVFGGSLGCNSDSQSQTLTIIPLPQVTDISTFVCIGTPVQLTVTGSSGATYSWNPNLWLNPVNVNVVSANPPVQQTYTIVASLNSCTNYAFATVSVMPLPLATIEMFQNRFCVNDSIILKGSGGVEYTWKSPRQLLSSGQTLRFKALSVNYAGIYSLTVLDENKCAGTTTTSVTVLNLPSMYLSSGNMKGCAPYCTDIVFEKNPFSDSLSSFNWQINGHSYTTNNFRECFYNPGDFILQGNFVDINNCINSVTDTINVYPKPMADFSYSPLEPVESLEQVQFFGQPDSAVLFDWEFMGKKNKSNLQNPKFLFENAGNYQVGLAVENRWGCSDTIIKIIKVATDFAIYIPNAFTPNNDDRNELFRPVMRGVKEFNLSIYNRWGEKLFETSDAAGGWDGSYNGERCKQDEYVWTLVVRSVGRISQPGEINDKAERVLTGTVLLIR